MRIPALAILCLCSFPAVLQGRVLLDSSEKTYARECLNRAASPEDLEQLCLQALNQGGYGRVQNVAMRTALGDARRWLGRLDAAEATYREILALDPRSTGALNGLGWVADDRGDDKTAAGYFGRSIAINPTSDGLGGYGETGYYADLLDADTALGFVEAALALERDIWTLRTKAWILLDERRYEAALASFQEALEIDSDDVNALKGLARTLSYLNRSNEALPHINRAVDLAPDDVDLLIWRSNISRWSGHNLRALKDAELVMQRAPARSDGVVLKARALSNMGFDYLALTTLRGGSDVFGQDSYFVYWLAELLTRDAQYDEALALLARNLAGGDANGHDYQLYAETALNLGLLVEARQAIEAGRKLAPWLDRLKYLECRLLVMEGDLDAAETAFAAAVDSGMSAGYAGDLAQAMIKQGEMQRAVAFRSRY